MGKNEVPGEITAIFTYSNFVKITTNHQLLTHLGHEPEFKREPTKPTERARFCPVNSAASVGQDVVYITVRYRRELFRHTLRYGTLHSLCSHAVQSSQGSHHAPSPQVAGQLWTLTKPHPNLCEDLGASSLCLLPTLRVPLKNCSFRTGCGSGPAEAWGLVSLSGLL